MNPKLSLSDVVSLLLLAFLAYGWASDGGIPFIPSAPFPADGLRVLVVEETADRGKLPESLLSSMVSMDWKNIAGSGNWRMLDKDAPITKEEPWVKAAMAVERDSLPWLLISNGNSGYSGPVPADGSIASKVKEYAK